MPSEYVSSGRYFQSIEMSEGEDVTMSVIDLLGEDILMYASDYPHSESWFPISVELVIGWTRIPESAKMKLFWAACSSSISVVAGRSRRQWRLRQTAGEAIRCGIARGGVESGTPRMP